LTSRPHCNSAISKPSTAVTRDDVQQAADIFKDGFRSSTRRDCQSQNAGQFLGCIASHSIAQDAIEWGTLALWATAPSGGWVSDAARSCTPNSLLFFGRHQARRREDSSTLTG
jgi:hypothetical protein